MGVEALISRLDKVTRAGPHRWKARCPAHDDKGPSLAIRELDDGRVLVHCFAGCAVESVLSATSLQFSDLFPNCLGGREGMRRERRPFPAADVLRCVAFEALVVACAGIALLDGKPFAPGDRERLILAVQRIQSALVAAGITNE